MTHPHFSGYATRHANLQLWGETLPGMAQFTERKFKLANHSGLITFSRMSATEIIQQLPGPTEAGRWAARSALSHLAAERQGSQFCDQAGLARAVIYVP